MKKICLFVVSSIILFLMVGCGSPNPEDMVEKFFNAAQNFDTETMAATFLPSNTNDIDEMKSLFEVEEEDDFPEYIFDYLKDNAKKMTYSITESKINGDEAVVTVEAKYVDSRPVLEATISELFLRSFSQAFSGDEMTDEDSDQLFERVLVEQIDAIDETYIDTTLLIDLIKVEDTWYIAETSDELLDVVFSGFISAAEDISDSFSLEEIEDSSLDEPEENIAEEDPADVLWEINNFVISDLWNDGFVQIRDYLETGKGTTGQDIDIDFTKSQLDKAMEKKVEYDEYIEGLDNSYSDVKEVWNKLSPEIDSLYDQVKSDAPSLNTDIFVQYRDAFSDLVYDLE